MSRNKRNKQTQEKLDTLLGLMPGMRMKGGVCYDPSVGGFVAIVHTWDNVSCAGEPKEWRTDEVFPTDEIAMHYYQNNIRPALEKMMAQAEKSNMSVLHRKLEE